MEHQPIKGYVKNREIIPQLYRNNDCRIKSRNAIVLFLLRESLTKLADGEGC